MSQNIVQQGDLNLAALNVEDVYVVIVPPGPKIITGVPTDLIGMVGTAHWGPKNKPIYIGSPQEAFDKLGALVASESHDLPTAVAVAQTGGGHNFVCIRVTDGTDVAATALVKDTSAATLGTFTAKYTGLQGNSLRVYVDEGSPVAGTQTAKVTIHMLGSTRPKEVYDKLTKTAAAFKAELHAAVTLGQGPERPPSEFVSGFGAGAGTQQVDTAQTLVAGISVPIAFTGGKDGDASGTFSNVAVTNANIVGNAASLTGMYALEGTGAFQFGVIGDTDTTTWGTIVKFALNNGMFAVVGFAANTTTDAAITAKNNAGIDTYAMMPIKDLILWDDPTNNVRRLVPPEMLVLGMVARLSPEQGVGNKPVFGIAGTERTQAELPYTNFEIGRLTTNGINFVTNPIPYGSVFGLRHNQNSSSDGTINGVNYTRMTNFLTRSFAAALGKYIGFLQSQRDNDETRASAYATLTTFLAKLKQSPAQGGLNMIDDFGVKLDKDNNPPANIAQGIMRADVAVRYLAVVRFFIISLQAGQSVVTVSLATQQGQALGTAA